MNFFVQRKEKKNLMYRLKNRRLGFPEGTLVYSCKVYDFNLAEEDTQESGLYHLSVSTNPGGGYPVFTVQPNELDIVE